MEVHYLFRQKLKTIARPVDLNNQFKDKSSPKANNTRGKKKGNILQVHLASPLPPKGKKNYEPI